MPAGLASRAATRDLRLLAAGVGVSTAGDSIALLALLLRLRPEGSGWVAAVLAAQVVPVVLLAPLVGQLIDRVETRRVLLAAVCGEAALAVPLALVHGPAITVALFLMMNGFYAAVRPSTNALVPAIVGEGETARGYARLALGQSFGWIVGPVAGGVLAGAFGTRTALLVDAGTFVLLAGASFLIRTRRRPSPRGGPREARGREARAGFVVLWEDRALRVALAVTAIATACAVLDNVAAPFRFVDQLGTTSTGYGAYLTIWGIGGLLGSQLPPRIPERLARFTPAAGDLLCSLGIAGIGAAPTLAVAFVASACGGLGNGMGNVALNTLVGSRVPEDRRGRAFAAQGAVTQGAFGTGTAAAAPLVSWLAADVAMMVAGGLGATAAALGLVALARRRR